jgi:uncharacterized membrane protein
MADAAEASALRRLFYLLYALGVVIFAVSPQRDGAGWGAPLW